MPEHQKVPDQPGVRGGPCYCEECNRQQREELAEVTREMKVGRAPMTLPCGCRLAAGQLAMCEEASGLLRRMLKTDLDSCERDYCSGEWLDHYPQEWRERVRRAKITFELWGSK